MFQRSLGNFGTNYTFLEELFFGISCKIYLVQDSSGKDYALKLFNKNVSQEHFEIELNACRLLCHDIFHLKILLMKMIAKFCFGKFVKWLKDCMN